jgi:hypothetical protein
MKTTILLAAVLLVSSPALACPDTGPPIAPTEHSQKEKMINRTAWGLRPHMGIIKIEVNALRDLPLPDFGYSHWLTPMPFDVDFTENLAMNPDVGWTSSSIYYCNCYLMKSGTGDTDVGSQVKFKMDKMDKMDVSSALGLVAGDGIWNCLSNDFKYESNIVESSNFIAVSPADKVSTYRLSSPERPLLPWRTWRC